MKTYESHVKWVGGKKGELTFENGNKTDVSSPVDFGGSEGLVTPEELLVAALNVCLHMTFVAIAQKMRIGLESFECEAEGQMDEKLDPVRFVKCTLRPKVSVSTEQDISRAEKAMSLSESRCFIANSVNFEVIIDAAYESRN